MGIPKFYRWLSERYPLLNQKLTLTEGPPDMDNLYLDMNGIIHNCTHANRKDFGNVTEEDMMLKIFDYLEKLIQIVRPQKLLFMAIDGVAPRAKMNQQRSRRFKSAVERLQNEEEQRRKGETVPDDPFDSNCITPGTEFMARLGKHLRFFIRRKIAEDPLWQKPTVIFSGHEVPGEGEHKIMEYIRWEKWQPNYQPNQRHCMYGLDADLIMLSLVTHEPHFCLLREVVSYTGNNRGQPAREVLDNPCAENFILFQIGLLREYFELEFGSLKLSFGLDLERIVDDYVLLCMLVGNDFLPALPTLDIAEGALNKLMEMYKEILPSLGGYITLAGDLDRRRLGVMLERVGQMELQTLEERAQDAEFMESKRAKRDARNGGSNRSQLDAIDAGIRSMAVSQPSGSARNLLSEALEPDAACAPCQQKAPTMMSREARQLIMSGAGGQGLQLWKDRYYNEKLHVCGLESRREVVEHYIAGLHWVLEYYYRGVASWDWYYPYHYAPIASDIVNLDVIQVAFAQGTPFRPFEQLLAVLPAASSKLLPKPFRLLMTDPTSPVIDFYPTTFEVDMEGKRADWEGVALVPFVDEVRLLAAARSVGTALLSDEEIARNRLGQIQVFKFNRNAAETSYCTSTMTKHFKDLKVCHSRCLERPPPPPLPTTDKGFMPVLVPGTRVGLATPPGMPTLKSLQVRPSLRNAGVNVLGTPSRRESVVLGLKDLREALGGAVLSAEQVATSGLLGSRAYINWPYLQEARVVRVSNRNSQVSYDTKGAVKVQRWQGQEVQRWEQDAAHLGSNLLSRCGMDVGKVDLVVGVKVCLGYIRHSDGTIEKTYSKDEVQVPLQAVLHHKPEQLAPDAAPAGDVPTFPTLSEGMQVVFLGKQHYGCLATVLPDLGKGLLKNDKSSKQGAAAANGHYRVAVQPVTEQAGNQALRSAKRVVERFTVKYYSSGEVSSKVGISPRLLGRITGNMWVREGDDRYDLGLAIKTSSKDVCVPGFSQPTEDGNGWTYSAAVINILQNYRKEFPWLWAHLMKPESDGAGDIRLDQMLPSITPSERKETVRQVTVWIKSTPLAKRPLVKLGTQVLSDEGVKALQSIVTPSPSRPPPPAEYENVPPLLLLPPYTPGADQVKLSVQGGKFQLGDRVVCVSGKGTPPNGLRGTVIGMYEAACEVVFDAAFSGGIDLNGRVDGKCGAFVPLDLLLCVNAPVEILLAKHQVPRQSNEPVAPAGSQSAGGGWGGPSVMAPKVVTDNAPRPAQRAVQQPAGTAPDKQDGVPAMAPVIAPVSPPVPSIHLLVRAAGTANIAAYHQSSAGNRSGTVFGNALRQELSSGTQGRGAATPSRGKEDAGALAGAAMAVAVAPPAPNSVTAGSLAHLRKLVPNARVGSPGCLQQGSQSHQGAPPALRPQSLPPTPQFDTPPFPPQPISMQGGLMPPPPMPQSSLCAFQDRAPYLAGGFHQHQHPVFFPPHGAGLPAGVASIPGSFPTILGPIMAGAMIPPPPVAAMGPMGVGGSFAAPLPAHQMAFTQLFPGASFQQTPPLHEQGQKRYNCAAQPTDSLSPGLDQAAAIYLDKSSGATASRPPNGTTAGEPAPASQSHSIDVDALQMVDELHDMGSRSRRSLAEGNGSRVGQANVAPRAHGKAPSSAAQQLAARSSGRATGAASQSSVAQAVPNRAGSGWAAGNAAVDEGRSGQVGAQYGKSARLPDPSGRGFRGRGRPLPAVGEPAAPGSQRAGPGSVTDAVHLLAPRHSLDCGEAGHASLSSLQAFAAATPVESQGMGEADPLTAGQPPPPNAGAALLRKLQQGSSSMDVSARA